MLSESNISATIDGMFQDKERAIESASEEVCEVSATLRVVSRFERNPEYKSETLGFGIVLGLS
jgi:uncharacterized OsmC-like protein